MHVVAKTGNEQLLKISRTLVVYENDAADTALVTIHDVLGRGPGQDSAISAPAIGPGRLLDRATLNDLLRSVSGLPQKREILPANVLFHDAGRMVWHIPASRRPIWFSDKYAGLNKTIKAFGPEMNGQEVLHPALLFVAEPGRLSVFALAGSDRPVASTPVFRAPYFNLYSSGLMCRGNVRLPDMLSIADMPLWEKGFFDTQFTHSNYGSLAVTLWRGGHDALWRAMRHRQNGRGFPARALAPASEVKTVGQVVSK